VTFEEGGVRYVAMRRIVENIGLMWPSQHVKLMDQTNSACRCLPQRQVRQHVLGIRRFNKPINNFSPFVLC